MREALRNCDALESSKPHDRPMQMRLPLADIVDHFGRDGVNLA